MTAVGHPVPKVLCVLLLVTKTLRCLSFPMVGRGSQNFAGNVSTTKGGLAPRHLVEQLVTAVEDRLYCITTRL